MRTPGNTVEEILANVPEDRKEFIHKLHQVILRNLPEGFVAAMSYGGLGYVIPLSVYSEGYHSKKGEPLPFAAIASQKHSVNFYHMGIYSFPEIMQWFVSEYPKHSNQKLDMGKSCVRFKDISNIPYELIGELMTKISAKDWIRYYEDNIKKTALLKE